MCGLPLLDLQTVNARKSFQYFTFTQPIGLLMVMRLTQRSDVDPFQNPQENSLLNKEAEISWECSSVSVKKLGFYFVLF